MQCCTQKHKNSVWWKYQILPIFNIVLRSVSSGISLSALTSVVFNDLARRLFNLVYINFKMI